MSNLYTNLSEVYEAMYRSFINYGEEFEFYYNLLKKYRRKSVLEIGCGTGNLANRFKKEDIEYTGLDQSDEMLSIAARNNPGTRFIKGDMRNFQLFNSIDSVIITGRTISYLIPDKDVQDTFRCINKNLNSAGIICFDCIDAAKFIPLIRPEEKIIHEAGFNNKKYRRESYWAVNHNQRGLFDWSSFYYEKDSNGRLHSIGEDHSTLRAFFREDITRLLEANGFGVKEIIDRPSYAFDTFVIVAERKRS